MLCALIKHECHMTICIFLNINVVCLFVLFTHENRAHDFHIQIMHNICV
jgi:hypothetical protein